MQIACPHCLTLNRVPSERLTDGAQCGACKQPLLPAEPIELSDANFARLIAHSELPIVVDFWADWCGPCKMMAPQYAQAARALHGRAILGKLDTEAAQRIAAAHNIRSIPTLAIFRDGKEIAREAGARPAAEIVRWVEANLR